MSDINELKLAHAKMKTGSLYQSWLKSNPSEANKFDAYVNGLIAGNNPSPPVLNTATGQGLVGYVDSGFKSNSTSASKFNGIGLWSFPQPVPNHANPKPFYEIAAGVEIGTWWWADVYGGVAKFPNATLKVTYKNGVEIKDDLAANQLVNLSASCVNYKNAKPEWIAKYNGQPLEAYNSKPGDQVFVAQLGNTAYQNQCAANINETLRAYGLKHVYIDNCYGHVTGVSKNNVLPDGITSDAQWRDTQVVPWIINTLSQVVAAGNYVFILVGDYPQAGETGIDYNDATVMSRYIKQLVNAEKAAGKPAFNGVLNEFFMQRANDNMPFHSGGGTWDGNAPNWQGLVKLVEGLGKDFHGLTYDNGVSANRFGRGSFWLDATGTHQSTHWVDHLDDPFLQLDLSKPAGPRVMEGFVDVRPYPNNRKLYVNMTNIPQKVANGMTIPATDSVFA